MPHRIYQAAQQAQQSLQHIQQVAQQLSQQRQGTSTFTGSQSVYQPGFAGTDPQQVRQDIQRGSQSGYNQFQGGYSGSQASFQSSGIGTNPQKVRQDIANDLHQMNQGYNPSYNYNQFQGNQGYNQSQGGFLGSQASFQSSGIGTNPQKVRQDIANDLHQGNQGYTPSHNYNQFQGNQGYNQSQGGYSGSQASFKSGGIGTNPQKVRQDIANDLNRGNQSGFTQ